MHSYLDPKKSVVGTLGSLGSFFDEILAILKHNKKIFLE